MKNNSDKTEKFDFSDIKSDFPILTGKNRKKTLVYLDSAASAQKPRQVINAISQFYEKDYANIHRGIYELSERSTKLYEQTREQIKDFIHAQNASEIVFVRGTTEGINLVAQSWGRKNLKAGDEIILSEMEHHSNIVPWYLLKQELGIELRVIPIKDNVQLDLEAYKKLFSSRTKLVAISHVSNAIGTINPVKEMTSIAHEHQAIVLIDGAQAIPHMPVNVTDIGCDFYLFSGHKIYGPTGIGILYGKKSLLDAMPPYQGGGDMIETVSFGKVTFARSPTKFEAGTPDIAGVIGLSAALRYVTAIGMENIFAHEQRLLKYAESKIKTIAGVHVIGAHPKVGVISFVMDDIHPHDIGTVLDHEGVAVRAGHHCAMPLMERLQLPATVRASFGVYTTEQDIDIFVSAIQLTKKVFS